MPECSMKCILDTYKRHTWNNRQISCIIPDNGVRKRTEVGQDAKKRRIRLAKAIYLMETACHIPQALNRGSRPVACVSSSSFSVSLISIPC
jgi:hypothetical protein